MLEVGVAMESSATKAGRQLQMDSGHMTLPRSNIYDRSMRVR